MVTYHDMDVLRTAQSQARQTARLADALERIATVMERVADDAESPEPEHQG